MAVSVALLVGMAVFVSVNYTNHAALIPELISALGITPTEGGLVSTATFATSAAAAPLAGSWADRKDARDVVTAGLLLVAIPNLVMPASYPLLLSAKAVVGAGTALGFVGGLRYGAAVASPHRRHFVQGWFGAGMLLGTGLGLYVAPLLLEVVSWPATFRITGGAQLAFVLLWAGRARPAAAVAAPRAPARWLLATANVWLLALVHATTFSMAVVVGGWLPSAFVARYAWELVVAGLAAALLLVSALAARPLGAWAVGVGFIRADRMLAAGPAVTALALGFVAVPDVPAWIALLAVAVMGFGAGAPFAALIEAVATLYPGRAGVAQGFVTLLATAFIVAGAPFVGALFQATGDFAVPFAVLAVTALGGAAAGVSIRAAPDAPPVEPPRMGPAGYRR